MTALCITGQHAHTLSEVAAHLGQAGMAAAQPLQRDPSVTLQVWHQRVCARASGNVQPSRLWEQLAVDLMLANLDAPLWGWADTQSHQLLDFWTRLDSDMHFVLLCQTPQQAITQLLVSGAAQDPTSQTPGSGSATAQALAEWHTYHQALLRFHLRHPGHSIMVWADQAQNTPQALVNHLNQHWQLALTEPAYSLESTAQHTTHADGSPNAVILQLAEYIAGLHPELDELNRELQATVTQLTDSTDSTDPADQEEPEHSEATTPASAADTVDALIASYRRLADRSAEQAALQALAETQAQLKDAQQESELLLLQLHQVQEELEKHYLQQQDTSPQLADLEAKLNAEAKAKVEALDQRDAESQAKTRAQTQLKDAQEEGELLLLQLHQVQEELEKYYLQHQEAQREVQAHNERWKRLLKAQPDLCDFDAVELLSDGGEGQPLQWRLNDASLAGRSFKQLNVNMIIEDGVAGFVIRRSANGESPLLRWPASAKSEPEITIIPVNSGPSAQRRAAHLVQLCASDWGLMLALPNVLTQALQRGRLAVKPARQQTLIKALGRTRHILQNMQGLVRFDRVSLTGQQSAGLRNVLAIKLDHTRYGQHSPTDFAFQLQINKNAAGQPDTAHFIFDEKTASAPFQTWASNTLNTAGQPVMAVRLDARGWLENAAPQLSPDDQSFMNALADSLAVMLVTLQADGIRADYPWQAWLKDAALLRQWSRQARQAVTQLAAPAKAAKQPKATPAATATLLSPKAKAPSTAKTTAAKVKPLGEAIPAAKVDPIVQAKQVVKAKPAVKAQSPAAAKPVHKPKARPANKTRRTKGAGN